MEKIKQTFIFTAISYISTALVILTTLIQPNSASAVSNQPLTQAWAQSLSKYVSDDGSVNYKAWKSDRSQLDSYISSLGKISPADYKKMNRSEQLALWINAYNAFTIKLVLDHYPIKRSGINFYPSHSIRQINGVWDKYKILVAGRNVNLSEIENKILRAEFNEPLIHFAINCASKSCPKLSPKPYTGSEVRDQLKQAARSFIMDSAKNKFNPSKKHVALSSIFQWYKDDFVKLMKTRKSLPGRSVDETAIIEFLSGFTRGSTRKMLDSNEFKLSYLPYDWSLNERK